MAKRKTKKVVIEEDNKEFKIDKYEASYISKGRTFVIGSYATAKDAKEALNRAGAHNQKIKHITK